MSCSISWMLYIVGTRHCCEDIQKSRLVRSQLLPISLARQMKAHDGRIKVQKVKGHERPIVGMIFLKHAFFRKPKQCCQCCLWLLNEDRLAAQATEIQLGCSCAPPHGKPCWRAHCGLAVQFASGKDKMRRSLFVHERRFKSGRERNTGH